MVLCVQFMIVCYSTTSSMHTCAHSLCICARMCEDCVLESDVTCDSTMRV